jgi:hypothetical protein
MARQSYLQRIAEPLRPRDPVLFAMPRPPQSEARAAAEVPVAKPAAPASSRRASSRVVPNPAPAPPNAARTPAPEPVEAATETPAPTERTAAGVFIPPASMSARTALDPAPAPREIGSMRDMIAAAMGVTIGPEPPGGPPPSPLSMPSAGSAPAPRIHIGTVEVRSAAPPPAPTPPTAAAPRMDATPISRGYAWRFGLIQG